jgi:hypothetical protein
VPSGFAVQQVRQLRHTDDGDEVEEELQPEACRSVGAPGAGTFVNA